MFAAREGDLESARLLVAAGANVNALDGDGKDSLGLAIFASLMPRFTKQAGTSLSAHVTPDHPEVAARLSGIARMLVGKGYDLSTANAAARRMLGGVVAQQATVLMFEKLFLLAGILFLAILPVLYFLKAPDDAEEKPAADVHVEM